MAGRDHSEIWLIANPGDDPVHLYARDSEDDFDDFLYEGFGERFAARDELSTVALDGTRHLFKKLSIEVRVGYHDVGYHVCCHSFVVIFGLALVWMGFHFTMPTRSLRVVGRVVYFHRYSGVWRG